MASCSAEVQVKTCKMKLWPQDIRLLSDSANLPADQIQQLLDQADKAMAYLPAPQPALHSAGVSDPTDAGLLASRRAFRDSDRAAILALAYRLSDKPIYQIHAKRILLAWAETYQPSGHPIDETRLDGLLWAYDLLHCQLTHGENQTIRQWLSTLQEKKLAWEFGPATAHNNYRTHQLKMLLLLDKLLDDQDGWQRDLAAVEQHLTDNIGADGATIDYQERDALYYHVYDLEAWTEIALLSGCCHQPIARAFGFLQQRLTSGDTHGEFAGSQSAFDRERSAAGFAYAATGGSYDVTRAIPMILSYNTMMADQPPQLWDIVESQSQNGQHIFKRVRYYLWHSNT
jgi:hypothetical protein